MAQQNGIRRQVGKSQQRHTRLARTQTFTGAANLQVAPGDLEAVIRLCHGFEALAGHGDDVFEFR